MTNQAVMGVVLAGGQGRRMGMCHKAFVELDGRPLIEHVIGRLKPQCDDLVISANQQQEKLSAYGYKVIGDEVEDAGPLAGVLAVMRHMRRHNPQMGWLLTAAVDTPLFPDDYRVRMQQGLKAQARAMACASSEGRMHPVFALWPLSLYADLKQAVQQDGQRKLGQWLRQQGSAEVDFSGSGPDPFFNINTLDDLKTADDLKTTGRFL